MQILADQNMPLVDELFSSFGNITRFDGRNIKPEDLIDIDVLLIRSVTKVDESLLQFANKLSFVGTATIGTDHVDLSLLNDRGINFSSAPGCNSVAVAEYVISAFYALAQEDVFDVKDKVFGILGYGNIGTRLNAKLKGLGIKTLLCDPIKALTDTHETFVDFDTLCQQADVISCHVPLVKAGKHKTVHLFDHDQLKQLSAGTILINASRGDVIDNDALLKLMKEGLDLSLVLDVWENEPNILTELLSFVRFGSVHIAGHTLEGKARGSFMLYQALCNQYAKVESCQFKDFLPQPAISELTLTDNFTDKDLVNLIHSVYDIRRDHGAIKQQIALKGFDYLRKNYVVRREFSSLKIVADNINQQQKLTELGFRIK